MISVEQVRALEERVERAIAYIAALKSENAALRRDLDTAQDEVGSAVSRVAELEASAEAFRRDQVSIEAGMIHALQKLDAFEDLVLRAESSTATLPTATLPTASAPQASLPQAAQSRTRVPSSHPVAEPKPVMTPIAAAATQKPSAEAVQNPESAIESSLPADPPAEATVPLNADELSIEELEAATAPSTQAGSVAVQPIEGELDIF